ncbi:MAG: hypothetical protein LAT82_04220 [Nanoarchaeota archaeon]|nr:hypothetical protein [Nanoarchaeota archaeon]
MLSTTEFFALHGVKFQSFKETISIYAFNQEQLEIVRNLKFNTFDDVLTYREEFFKIFNILRTIEYYPIITIPIQNLYEFNFTPKNRLISRKKEQFEHISSLKDVFSAIENHYDSFSIATTIKKKSFDIKFEDLRLQKQCRAISLIVEDELHMHQTKNNKIIIDLKSKIQEKKNLVGKIEDCEKKYNKFEKNYLYNVKKEDSLKLKLQKLTSKLQDSKLKKQRLEHEIREVELSLQELQENSTQKTLFIPLWQAVVSAGLLCYSKLNSFEYQQYKLKKQIFSKKKTIEELNSQELTLNFKIEQLEKDLEQFSSKTSKHYKEELSIKIDQYNQELLEINDLIFDLEKNQKNIIENINVCEEHSSKKLISELNSLLQTIVEQYEMIENYVEILTISSKLYEQHRDESLEDGFYYTQKI